MTQFLVHANVGAVHGVLSTNLPLRIQHQGFTLTALSRRPLGNYALQCSCSSSPPRPPPPQQQQQQAGSGVGKRTREVGRNSGVGQCMKRRVAAALAIVVVVAVGAGGGGGGGGGGEAAMAFGWFGQQQEPAMEKDPVEPFTLYGSIVKKYLIENIVEGKVVGRKKGFTASACVNALDESKETPQLQGVPPGLKLTMIGKPSCSKGEGQTRDESCTSPCRKACQTAISRHAAEVKEETGYILDPSDSTKATDACSLQCFAEWIKVNGFVVPPPSGHSERNDVS